MIIAIIGASGFIGNRIHQTFSKNNSLNVIGTFFKDKLHPQFIYLDVTSKDLIEHFLIEFNPNLIFWIAGSKNLNKCEDDWEYAFKINSKPIKDYYEIKSKLKIESKLVFFSTDYVFDGLHGNYKDTDLANPKTNYGISNKIAEDTILNNCSSDLIIRTSAVMGKGGKFFDWLTKCLVNDKKVKIFKDIYFSPTPIQLLSEATEYLIKKQVSGIVHICGELRLSRYEFAEKLLHINKKFSATVVPDSAFRNNLLFQRDLSLIQSKICKKFQTKDFAKSIMEELSS